jgi:hypothetical protein
MFKWKHYVKLLYRESKSTCPHSLPKDDYGNEIQHYVEFLEQIANYYSRIESYNCLKYKNIRFYVYENQCSDGEHRMRIELIDGKDSLFVFEDGTWLHYGAWCKQIENILKAVDKRVTGKKRVLEVIKETKQIVRIMQFTNKWERNNKEA